MKPLILVKHSLPEILEHIPARGWSLSAEGRERAGKLAEKLRRYHPDVIVSSIEPKAIQTAEILAERLELSYQIAGDLHEHDRSQSSFYTQAEFQSLVREFFNQPTTLVFGSETADQCLIRFRHTVEQILKTLEDKTTVIVAHGTVSSLYVAWLTGCDGYELWQKLDLPSFMLLDLQSKRLLEIINLD